MFDGQYWVRDDGRGGQVLRAKCGADVFVQVRGVRDGSGRPVRAARSAPGPAAWVCKRRTFQPSPPLPTHTRRHTVKNAVLSLCIALPPQVCDRASGAPLFLPDVKIKVGGRHQGSCRGPRGGKG